MDVLYGIVPSVIGDTIMIIGKLWFGMNNRGLKDSCWDPGIDSVS